MSKLDYKIKTVKKEKHPLELQEIYVRKRVNLLFKTHIDCFDMN